jgi:ubiquinone/menaquinone biosynthesis C-methylase UbiE
MTGHRSGFDDLGSADLRDRVVRAQFADPFGAASYAELYRSGGPSERYFASRLHAVSTALRGCPGGSLLDAGCGPGMFVEQVLHARPGDFRVTALDQSPAMIAEVARRTNGADARLAVGQIDDMPFTDATFDVLVAMGVLEYCPIPEVLGECARVVRTGGLVLVTMLNPLSPYRLFEWALYWPLLRVLGRVEGLFGRPPERRHGACRSGIRAVSAGSLQRMMRAAGLEPVDVVHYDVTPVVPPLDRALWRWVRGWRERPDRTLSRGAGRWLGSAYLVSARRR